MTLDNLYQAAVRFLAQRDYTRQEIRHKLKLLSDNDIDAVLTRLELNGYLNDTRFVENFIRICTNKGHGPIRILQALQKKGIGSDTALLALEDACLDWYSIAEKVRQKKFGNTSPINTKDKARQMRFLQYRGFSIEVVMALF